MIKEIKYKNFYLDGNNNKIELNCKCDNEDLFNMFQRNKSKSKLSVIMIIEDDNNE